ncbi:MAG: DUF4271 domain-containing protein [Bacteroidota bacterium]|nr:DUF4271 domain-containing protein [Bacteroidota bacterium]
MKGNHCLAAQEKTRGEHLLIKNLKNDLLVYDEDLKNYLPFISGSELKFPTLSYYCNLRLYAGNKIQHCLPKGSSIFIDQKIIDFFPETGCKILSIDSLLNIYENDTVFITLYNTNLDTKNLDVSIISDRKALTTQIQKSDTFFLAISREFNEFNDFFIIGLIILMILITVLYNGNLKYFLDFYNLPRALSIKIRKENYLSVKNISGTYLLFLIVHSFLVGFVSIILVHYNKDFQDLLEFVETNTFWAASLSWVQISLFIFLLFILKYILVKGISQLFNIKSFSTVHYFDFIRMSIIFYLLLLIILSILMFSFGYDAHSWSQPILTSIIIFFIVRMVVLFFKLYKYAPFRNLHLFLYICSTELLPLMVGFKIFIK